MSLGLFFVEFGIVVIWILRRRWSTECIVEIIHNTLIKGEDYPDACLTESDYDRRILSKRKQSYGNTTELLYNMDILHPPQKDKMNILYQTQKPKFK